MKIVKTSVLSVALSLCLLQLSAQNRIVRFSEPNYNKPQLFTDLPQQMKLKVTNLESLIDLPVGSAVTTQLAEGFAFRGTIVSRSNDRQVKSVVVKSINRQGATLIFTQTLDKKGSPTYLGRIISLQHGDAYEINRVNGSYILQKKELNDLVSE